MFSEEARAAVEGMAASRDSVYSTVMSDFLIGVVSHAAEMSMPVVKALTENLAGEGRSHEGNALLVDGIAAWSPDVGSRHAALVLVVPAANGRAAVSTVTSLKLDRNGAVESVKTSVFRKDPDKALKLLRSDGYNPDIMLDRNRSFDMSIIPGMDDVWMNLSMGSRYHDSWDVHLAALERIAKASGLGHVVDTARTEYLSRKWKVTDTIGEYAAAQSATFHAIKLDEGLPSIKAREFVANVETLSMGLDLARSIGKIEKIVVMADANGHGADGEKFDFDDGDSTVLVSAPAQDGSRALHLTDQNCSLVLRFSEDRSRWAFWRGRDREVEVPSASDDADDDEDFHVVSHKLTGILLKAFEGRANASTATVTFTRTPEGMMPDKVHSGGIGDVRSWNSLMIDIEGAAISLKEEYGSGHAPSV